MNTMEIKIPQILMDDAYDLLEIMINNYLMKPGDCLFIPNMKNYWTYHLNRDADRLSKAIGVAFYEGWLDQRNDKYEIIETSDRRKFSGNYGFYLSAAGYERYQRRMTMEIVNIGNEMHYMNEVQIESKNGNNVNIYALFMEDSIKIFQTSFHIECGDRIIRTYSGGNETYIVTKVRLVGKTNILPEHFDVKADKEGELSMTDRTNQVINNFNGDNARYNHNSTDNSYNIVKNSDIDLKELASAISQIIPTVMADEVYPDSSDVAKHLSKIVVAATKEDKMAVSSEFKKLDHSSACVKSILQSAAGGIIAKAISHFGGF